jgi:hypothetical protein
MYVMVGVRAHMRLRLDQPQYQPCKLNYEVDNRDSKTLVKNFKVSKFVEHLASEEDDLEQTDEGWYTLFTGEDKLQEGKGHHW